MGELSEQTKEVLLDHLEGIARLGFGKLIENMIKHFSESFPTPDVLSEKAPDGNGTMEDKIPSYHPEKLP